MSDIATKLEYLNGTKQKLKQAINNLGGDITNETTFRNYATELDTLYSNLPKVEGEGSSITLSPTLKGKMNIIPKGDTQQGKLPSTYQQVEYIEGTGTQYITTNYKLTNNNAQIKTKVYIPEMIDTENDIIGNQDSASGRFVMGMFNKTIFAYSKNVDTQDPNVQSATLSGSQTLEIDLTYNLTTHKKTLKVNGASTETTYYSSIISTKAIQIFANGENNNGFTGRVYYVEVYDNGTLKLHLIPCYRVSDNVIGMYDLVSNTFFTNAGSGTFTKGNNAPTPSTPIDIEVVTGTQEVKVENKNLWNKSKMEFYNNNNSAFIDTGGTSTIRARTNSINISELGLTTETTYILSGLPSGWTLRQIRQYTEYGGTSTDKIASSNNTFSITSGFKYIHFMFGNENGTTTPSILFEQANIQLEKGSTATPYTPHQEQTQVVNLGDIELCKIGNYQDYLYKSNGNWYKKEYIYKKILNGTETINVWTNNRFTFSQITDYKKVANTTTSLLLSTHYKATARNLSQTDFTMCFYDSNESVSGLILCDSIHNTLSTLQTWLGTNNVTLYYVLATPNDIQITNTNLIEQLDNIENLMSYNGQTNIEVVGDLPMIMKVRALKGE